MLSESLGKVSFWLFFIGFNTTFFPMHILGLWGMPRRVYTYAPGLGWDTLNLTASLGAVCMGVAILSYLWNVVAALRAGAPAADNPWHASTLEWATSSPPPPYNFAHPLVVASADPLWLDGDAMPRVTGLRSDIRDVLVTTVMDAEPEHRTKFPDPSIWPFLTAMAVTMLFIASIYTPWGVVWGAIPVTIAMIGWFWPKPDEEPGTREWPFEGRDLPLSTEPTARGAAA
jgi:cytochrome c oxidase subunit 1